MQSKRRTLLSVFVVVLTVVLEYGSLAAEPRKAEPGKENPEVRSEDAPGFVSLFDGQTLKGWKAVDMSWWSVEDGAITAKITEQKPCDKNQYLFCEVGPMKDFELKLVHRMITTQKVNGGFQFRSAKYQGDDCKGYQVDNNTDTPWLVRLYDEFGRHTLAWRGQRTVIDRQGQREETAIDSNPEDAASSPAKFDLHRWHEYHLTCRGERLTLKINGQPIAEVIDKDPRQQDLSGLLALQLHSGPVMTVQFKDIRYKPLPSH